MAFAAGLWGSLKPVFVLGVGERRSCWKPRVRLQQQIWKKFGTQGFCRVTCSSSGSFGQGNRQARRKIGGEKLSKKDILLVEQLAQFIAQQDLPANQLPSIKELTSRGRSDLAYAVRSRGYQAVSRMLGNPRFRRGSSSGSNSDSDCGGRAGRGELASSLTSSVNVSVQVEVVSGQALTEEIEDVGAEQARGSWFSFPRLDSPSVPNVATLQHPGRASPPGEVIAEDNTQQVVPFSSVGVPRPREDVGALNEVVTAAALASEQKASISSVLKQDRLHEDSSPVASSLPPQIDSQERSVSVLSSEQQVSLWVSTGESSSLRQSASSETGVPQEEDLSLPTEVRSFLGQVASDSVSEQGTENVSPSEQRLQPEAGTTERSLLHLSSEERARLCVATGQTNIQEQAPSSSSTEPVASASISKYPTVGQEASVSLVSDAGDLQHVDYINPVVQPSRYESGTENKSVSRLSREETTTLLASTGLPSLLEESRVHESASSETGAQQPDVFRSEGHALEQQSFAPTTEHDSENLGTAQVSLAVPDAPSHDDSDVSYVFDLLAYEREMLPSSKGLSSPLEESGSSEAPSGVIDKLDTAEGELFEMEKSGRQGPVPITEQDTANVSTEIDSLVVQELQSKSGSDERSVLVMSIEESDRLFLSAESLEALSGGTGTLNTSDGTFAETENLLKQGSVPRTKQGSVELRTESGSPVVQELQSQEASSGGIGKLKTAQEVTDKQESREQGSVPITEQESNDRLWNENDIPVVQEPQFQAGSGERSVLDLSIEERARFFLSSVSFEAPSGDIDKLNTTEGDFTERQKLGQQGFVPITEQESTIMQTERDSLVVQELQSHAGLDERNDLDLPIEEKARNTGLSSLLAGRGSLETQLCDFGKLDIETGLFSEQENSWQGGSGLATEQDSENVRTESTSPAVTDLQAQAILDKGSLFDLSVEERAKLFLSTGLSNLETASGGVEKLKTEHGELSEKGRSVQQSSLPVSEYDSTNPGTKNVSPVVPNLQSQVVSNERSVFDLSIQERARLFVSTGLSSILQESERSAEQGQLSETDNLAQQGSAPVSEQDFVNPVSKSVSPVVSDPQSQGVPDERTVCHLSFQERARLFLSTGLPSIVEESGTFETPSGGIGGIGKLSTGQEDSTKKLRETRDQLRQKLLEIRKGAEGLKVLRESLRARTEWRDKEDTKSGVLEEAKKLNNDGNLWPNESAMPQALGEIDIASSGLQPDDEVNSQEGNEEMFAMNDVQGFERIADYDYHSDGLSWEADQPDGVVPEREETIAAQMGPILQAKLQLESALDATFEQQDRDRIIFSILAKQQEIGRLAEKRKEVDVQLQEQAQIEIDSLKSALQLREAEVLSLRQELLEMKAELMLVQGKVSTDIAQAKVELEEERRKLQDAEVAVSRLKKVSVEWWGEGTKVELAGSFNGWQHFFPFQPDLRSEIPNFDGSRGPMLWGLDLLLYPGVYEIKFIVDGIWTIDHRREMVMRDTSVQNNLLRVEP